MSTTTEIKLGQRARDVITGFEGIITAKIEFINGCTQYNLTGKAPKSGDKVPEIWIDWQRVEIKDDGVRSKFFSNPSGGPSTNAPTSYRG